MNPIYQSLQRNDPVIFAKFGDGEYACAVGSYGSNCDGDSYNPILSNELKSAAVYYSEIKNAYLGAWHTGDVPHYFSSLTSNTINWIDYHTFVMDEKLLENNDKLNIYRAIKENPRKKIIIANELLVKSKLLLNIDRHIVVPYRNWFRNSFNSVLNSVLSTIGDDDEPLIITCCGMGAKVLIMELHKRKPNGIYLDIGSGIDYLCTKKSSRGHPYSYDAVEKYFESILPNNWNDPSYDYIYEAANRNLGIHLG